MTVDGAPVDFTQHLTWRGVMISGLPNMAYTFGYFRDSWTPRVDLVSDLVGRPLTTMRDKGATMVVPTRRPEDTDMQLRRWCDPENFNSGYVMRSEHIMFRQVDREPWTHMLEHDEEREIPPKADLYDGTLVYRRVRQPNPAASCWARSCSQARQRDFPAAIRSTSALIPPKFLPSRSTWPTRPAMPWARTQTPSGPCDPSRQAVQVGRWSA